MCCSCCTACAAAAAASGPMPVAVAAAAAAAAAMAAAVAALTLPVDIIGWALRAISADICRSCDRPVGEMPPFWLKKGAPLPTWAALGDGYDWFEAIVGRSEKGWQMAALRRKNDSACGLAVAVKRREGRAGRRASERFSGGGVNGKTGDSAAAEGKAADWAQPHGDCATALCA